MARERHFRGRLMSDEDDPQRAPPEPEHQAANRALAFVEQRSLPLAGLDLDDQERIARYLERASSTATLRAYRSDWAVFEAWCSPRGLQTMPATPFTVAAFLTDLADQGRARSTIGRRLAAIVFAHRAAGHPPPTDQVNANVLDRAMRGVRADKRADGVAKKRAADGDILRDMLRAIDGDSVRALRDRALLAIGMGGAFRRSELVAIRIDQVSDLSEGLRIHVPHAKGDQLGRGATVVIPDRKRIGPVALYRAWIAAAPILDGFVFRKLTPQGRLTEKPMSDKGVALVVKARAAAAGYDPGLFSGHSLRAGFLTEAGRQGANLFKMKDHSRHKSLEMVSEYVRDHEAFRDHAGDKFL